MLLEDKNFIYMFYNEHEHEHHPSIPTYIQIYFQEM